MTIFVNMIPVICLSVSPPDYLNLSPEVCSESRNNPLDFGDALNYALDTGSGLWSRSH